jgi:hypothetical protein
VTNLVGTVFLPSLTSSLLQVDARADGAAEVALLAAFFFQPAAIP